MVGVVRGRGPARCGSEDGGIGRSLGGAPRRVAVVKHERVAVRILEVGWSLTKVNGATVLARPACQNYKRVGP